MCIRLNNAGKWACDRLTEDSDFSKKKSFFQMKHILIFVGGRIDVERRYYDYRRCRFWQKKIIFSNEAHFDLGGYANKQNCLIWGTENPHTYIGKPTNPKRVNVWCGFWSRGIIASKMSKERPLQSMTIVIGPCWMNFCSQKLKRRIEGTGRRYVPHSLHSMFCALFLKIALSATELMSFGHVGAAI